MILVVDIIFNFVMLTVDVAIALAVGRRPKLAYWLVLTVCGLAAWLMLGGVAVGAQIGLSWRYGGEFWLFRMAAWTIFVHGPISALLCGYFAWRDNRRIAIVGGLLSIGVLAVGADAFLYEPTALVVTKYEFADARIKEPTRLVVLADLQTDAIGPYERDVFIRVLALEPDIIFLAGDYFHFRRDENERRFAARAKLREHLDRIGFPGDARLYGIQGNIDPCEWTETFVGLENGGLLVNQTKTVELGELGLDLTLLGVSESRDLRPTIDRPHADRMHVVLGHCPDFALSPVDADLLLAGHTHGGQVRVPGFGPLTTHSSVPREWASGLTVLPKTEDLPDDRRLLVSRGVGMERDAAPRLRFNCRPELVVIDLVPTR